MLLKIEVAKTPDQLARGLMFRDKLPPDSGMLFKFDSFWSASFWGKNTYIPLDVAFISPDGKIESIKHIAPMSTKTVHSNSFCSMAVEANAGFFDKHGIKPGFKMLVDEDEQSVRFVEDA
jgi:uncharacterized membrane protein (UPF0127 family)